MTFIKYNDIENSTNKMVHDFKESNMYVPSDMWNVTPKVHGSNFSIYMEDGELIPAKRSGNLSMESSFFNFQKIFDKYDFKTLICDILTTYKDSEFNSSVSVHGELCGGFYPDMPVIPGVKMVQKEVKYSNDIEFIVFDIRIYNTTGQYMFLPHDEVVNICNIYNIPVVPIIFSGSLDECLSWSSEHNADDCIVHEIFNMPKLEGNIREGHVIKPYKSMFKGMHRVIFKDKNNKFKECKDPNNKNAKPKIEYSDNLMNCFSFIEDLVNINRFNSVTSKFGEYTIKDFQALMNDFTDDVINEYKRDSDLFEYYVQLSNEDIKQLTDYVRRIVSKFMVENKKTIF